MGSNNMVTGLIPARFMTLTAHLVLVIIVLWTRELVVRTCVPTGTLSTDSAYTAKDTEMIIAFSVTLGLFAIEFIGFLGGISMFAHTQGLLSTAVHAAACVTLAFFIFDEWHCDTYWYVFGFCSALPAVTEIVVMVGVLLLHRSL